MSKIKILTFSTLYPNTERTRHGIFVETRLRYLLQNNKVESRVVSPVPWFPVSWSIFGEYAKNKKIPPQDVRHNIQIDYPRFLLLPKVGMTLAPFFMAVFAYPRLKKIQKDYNFQIIDAHYFYPDGVAAIILGKWLNKPVTITARGTDLNLIPKYLLPRKMIQWAAKNASGLITVCQALKEVLIALGVPEKKVHALRNGVNLDLFTPPENREILQKKLNLSGKNILSVGHLIERKGHHLVIEALKKCPEVTLYIAGDGEKEQELRKQVMELNLQERVVFLGNLNQSELRNYYGAVDMLVLASSREGWANVLLESMACGTPVIATNVWGTPEVVAKPESGILVDRSAEEIRKGINKLYTNYPDRKKTRLYAEKYSWDATTKGQEDLFKDILDKQS